MLTVCLSCNSDGLSEFPVTHHAEIRGVVTGSLDQPLSNAEVFAWFAGVSASMASRDVTSDVQGGYRMRVVGFSLRPTDPDSVPVTVIAHWRADRTSPVVSDSVVAVVRFVRPERPPLVSQASIRLPVP